MRIIYGLYDPRPVGPPQIRYVGYTGGSLSARVAYHIWESRKRSCYRHNWISKLIHDGASPQAIVLEEIAEIDDWQERERHWIAHLRGHRLTNSTAGGEGLIDPSEEVRRAIGAKVSASLRGNQRLLGHKHSAESKAKISAALRGRKMPPRSEAWVQAQKIAQKDSNRGVPKSAEHRAAISAGLIGNKNWLGKNHSEETKLKMSVSKLGNKNGLGHTRSDEHREAIRARRQGSRWINNGISQTQLRGGEPLPDGWALGRLRKAGD